jgi:hypothetical protein
MDVLVYPFSFREVLRHAGLEPTTVAKRWTKGERSVLEKALHAYLTGGGWRNGKAGSGQSSCTNVARDKYKHLAEVSTTSDPGVDMTFSHDKL